MSSWLDVCRAFAGQSGVEPEFVDALTAFASPNPRGGPPAPLEAPFEGDFEGLESSQSASVWSVERIADDLAAEVDHNQALMFARRLAAVSTLLDDFGDPTARVLRAGLRHRLQGILGADRPRALRVRALADFYYSYAGRHHHHRRHRDRPSWTTALDQVEWTSVAPGLDGAKIEGPFAEGPVHVNLLRLKPGQMRIEAVDCRTRRHAGLPFGDVVEDVGALAAVSGGFFLYSETPIEPPERRYDAVDLLMIPGEVINPPVFGRAAIAVTTDGQWAIDRITSNGMLLRAREHMIPMTELTHRAMAERGPDLPSISVAGRVVVDVGRSLRVPVGGFVMPIPDGLDVAVADEVEYGAPQLSDGRRIHTAVGGGPLLVKDGAPDIDLRAENFWGSAPPVTFSQDETGDRNLLPRLGAGLDDQGQLVLAAVDGRNFDQALGMTLADMARLFVGLGCHTATNLDGGSSKRMVVQGQTLDLPSTEIDPGRQRGLTAVSIRPVYTALMVFPTR